MCLTSKTRVKQHHNKPPVVYEDKTASGEFDEEVEVTHKHKINPFTEAIIPMIPPPV